MQRAVADSYRFDTTEAAESRDFLRLILRACSRIHAPK
jgi:hypothetical protein